MDIISWNDLSAPIQAEDYISRLIIFLVLFNLWCQNLQVVTVMISDQITSSIKPIWLTEV